jgi:hypothetical protein
MASSLRKPKNDLAIRAESVLFSCYRFALASNGDILRSLATGGFSSWSLNSREPPFW